MMKMKHLILHVKGLEAQLCINHMNKCAHTLSITYYFGFKRRLDLFVCQPFPVNASEEGLLPDVHLTFWATAETLGWMLGHQLVTTRSDKRM